MSHVAQRAAAPATVPVHEWLYADGTSFGLGTKIEFDYHLFPEDHARGAKLGKIICQEPASEDERRKAAWGVA